LTIKRQVEIFSPSKGEKDFPICLIIEHYATNVSRQSVDKGCVIVYTTGARPNEELKQVSQTIAKILK